MLPYPLLNARKLHGGSHGSLGPIGLCSAAAHRQYDSYVRSGLTLALMQLRDRDESPTVHGSGTAEAAN